MSAVLDYILKTNLFNFIIFAGIIGYLVIKLDVRGSLNKAKDDVAETIEASEAAKILSEEHLSEIEESVSHLSDEIDEIISRSIDNAKLVGEQINADAQKGVVNIKDNSKKLVENKTALLKNDIMKRASLASVEVAKDFIISELNSNQDLHNKLIDESIEQINGVEL